MSKKGFTLAEILITLGVIGVVAAITMPTLIKNYQKSVIENRLKKTYSIINQAFSMSIAHNGDIKNWNFPQNNTEDENYNFAKTYLFPYLKVIKDCKGSNTDCWIDTEYKMNGNAIRWISGDRNIIKFIINDGANVALYFSSSSSGHLYIDVNGKALPNTRGKDIFEFIILPNSNNGSYIKPKGYNTYIDNVKSECRDTGNSCIKLIMDNGWKFSTDYPW